MAAWYLGRDGLHVDAPAVLFAIGPQGKMVSKKRKASGSDSIDRCLHGINWLSGLGSPSRRNVVLVLGFSLFALAGYGVTLAQVDHDPLKFYFEDNPLRVGIETLDEHVAGAGSMSVLVERMAA